MAARVDDRRASVSTLTLLATMPRHEVWRLVTDPLPLNLTFPRDQFSPARLVSDA